VRLASLPAFLVSLGVLCAAQGAPRKNSDAEHIYPQPPSAVRAALKKLPGGTSGPLPVLDGFVVPGQRGLDGYRRPYYQCTVRITPAPTGGSRVRVIAKITAWHSGPDRSGYDTLESNGRLESDLLDRLQDFLDSASASTPVFSKGVAPKTAVPNTAAVGRSGSPVTGADPPPDISAPVPQMPRRSAVKLPAPDSASGPADPRLQEEAKNLEEILRNQTHPTNLVAVKRDQTPVSESPSSNAKVLFLASAEDEFEVLDVNPAWVHVRISGLSRGWLRRSSVEILDDSSAGGEAVTRLEKVPQVAVSQTPGLFSVSSDEVGTFPGEWGPLKGKSVKMISVQQAPGSGRITSPQDKMRFAESVFRKERLSSPAEGLVLIFDAEDGGMIAATSSVLEQWKNGSIAELAFWKQCFLDPPEILGGAN
jgi:hypothetical protein